jgi:diguanylate cyclase (GGDEF)-like protein
MSILTAQVLDDELAASATERSAAQQGAHREESDHTRRERLFARLTDSPHLPSPPGLVLQILEKVSRLECAPADLAADIHRDAALCGKILKTVNSALCGMTRSITSINRAVTLLGLKPVRSLVLSLSLPALQRQATSAPPEGSFWKESVAGAMVAHELAIRLRRHNPEDDLVAGLLRDIGLLALQQVCPTEYGQLLNRSAQELILNRCRLERQVFGVDHAEVSAFLLGRWWLPEEITQAVQDHHAPERAKGLPRPAAERAHLLSFASLIAQLQVGICHPVLLRDIFAFGREHFGLDEAALTAFLEPLAKKIEDFAALLEIDIGSCDHYPRIMARAAEQLVQLTLETSVDHLRMLEQKRQAEQEKEQWRAEAQRLRDEMQRDPLTGAFNRGCLEEELRIQFRRARRRGTLLGLIFIDLDNFKGLNDRFGHLFGDRVLKETSRSLFNSVRHGDIVARYGGDEFCILVENTSPQGLRAMADRLWKVLNELTIPIEELSVAVRASIGAVLCLPRTYPRPATEFLEAADRAMYVAKSTGKNQITFLSLLDDSDLCFLDNVQRRCFRAWLSELNLDSLSHFGLEVRRSGSRFESPGRLARRLGWLTEAQVRQILRERRDTRRRFDEIAGESGLLTPDQLSTLLALQLEPPEQLAATLVKQGVISEDAMREKLRNFYQRVRSASGVVSGISSKRPSASAKSW